MQNRSPLRNEPRRPRWMRALILACCASTGLACAQGVANPAPPGGDRPLRLDALESLLALPPRLPLGSAGSGDSPGAAALGLLDTARRGLAYSLDLEASRQRLEAARYGRDAARGALLPRAELRAATGQGRLTSVDPELSLPRREVGATLRQALVNEPARLEWSRQGLLEQAAAHQLDSATSAVLLEVGNAWLAVLQSSAQVRLGTEYEALLDELGRYVTERAAAGGASLADRDRVRARVANTRGALSDSRAALQVALRTLERLTGGVPAALAVTLPPTALAVPQDKAVAHERALQHNAELLAARTEVAAAEKERATARAAYFPRLELEVTRSTAHNAAGTAAYTNDTKAMVVLTVPLVNGGSDFARHRAAEARRAELDAVARNAERRLTQEVETVYANLDASAQRFGTVRDELEANTKVVAAFRAQMVGATRPLLDVLDAYQRLHQSRLDLLQALVAEAQNHLRLNHLTGTLAPLLAPAP